MQANATASEENQLSEEEVIAQIAYDVIYPANFNSYRVAHLSRSLVVAGTDTTSNALTRTLHLLSLHPDAQDKLRDELRVACEDNEELTHDRLVSLPYLEAVCRETLRLCVTSLRLPHQF